MRALVTGAGRPGGIGEAIADRLAEDSFEVVTIDREPGCTWQADLVTDPLPDFGAVDALVCNAALTTMFGAAHTFKPERWKRDLDVNLTATLRVVQACLPGMRERRYGRIVFISAGGALWGLPGQVGYATTKAGILGMSRTIAAENVALGVTSNVVVPGMTASSGVLAMPVEIIEQWRAHMPMGDFVQVQDIADAAAFFASRHAGRVTGQEMTVDGGLRLNTLSVTRDRPPASA